MTYPGGNFTSCSRSWSSFGNKFGSWMRSGSTFYGMHGKENVNHIISPRYESSSSPIRSARRPISLKRHERMQSWLLRDTVYGFRGMKPLFASIVKNQARYYFDAALRIESVNGN